jgi:hypothetical protein
MPVHTHPKIAMAALTSSGFVGSTLANATAFVPSGPPCLDEVLEEGLDVHAAVGVGAGPVRVRVPFGSKSGFWVL